MATNPQDNRQEQLLRTPPPQQNSNPPASRPSPNFSNMANSSGFSLFGSGSAGSSPFSTPQNSQGGTKRPLGNILDPSAMNNMFSQSKNFDPSPNQFKNVFNSSNPMFSGVFNNKPAENSVGDSNSKSNSQAGASKQQSKNLFGGSKLPEFGTKAPTLFSNVPNSPMFGKKKEEDTKQATVENPKKSFLTSLPPFSKKQPTSTSPSFTQNNNLFSGSSGNLFSNPLATRIEGDKKAINMQNIMGSVSSASPEFIKSIAPTIPEKYRTPQNTPQNTQNNQNPASNSNNVQKKQEKKQEGVNKSENKQKLASLFGNNNSTNALGSLFNPAPSTNSSTNPLFGLNPSPAPATSTNSTSSAIKGMFGNRQKKQTIPATTLFQIKKSHQTSTTTPNTAGNDSTDRSLNQQSSLTSSKTSSISFGDFGKKTLKPTQKTVQVTGKQEAVLIKQSSNQPKMLFGKPPQSNPTQTQPQPQARATSTPTSNLPNEQSGKQIQFSFNGKPRVELDPSSSNETSSILNSKTTLDKQVEKSTKDATAKNSVEERKPFGFLKTKEIVASQIIDYRTIRQQEKKQSFSTFLSHSMKKIITSLKLYFTFRTSPFKPVQNSNSNNNERTKFLNDLTNLLLKNLGLASQSFDLLNQFIQKIIAEQRYQNILFRNDYLNTDYIVGQSFYLADYGNKFQLNEISCKELFLLSQKIVNKWYIERINIIKFLTNHSDLFHKPSDLFSYFFKYLLQSEDKLIETPNQLFCRMISDFQILIKRKISQLLDHYNKKLNNFKVFNSPEQIKTMIKLIQHNRDQEIEEISLKILLNSVNFKHNTKEGQTFEAIKQTKSFALIPFRAIAYKISQKRHQFLPNPKDLYKNIKGNQWIDWFDLYLSDNNKEGIELQTNQPEKIVQSLCTIDAQLLIDRLLKTKKGILKFFNLLQDENMINLYYKILEACIFNERSIAQIEQFYFKKMNFNSQYQQIIQYIVNFNENTKSVNQANILVLLQAKMSLLIKILQISPNKLVELQRCLFNSDYNKFKRFKPNNNKEGRPQGQKIIHLFLDTINIVSIKNLSSKILNRVFSVITYLLRNKQTEKTVLNALKLNRPSFSFLQNNLHVLTLQSMNKLLQYVLSESYIQDLIFSYQQCKDQQIRMESFFAFRYQDQQFYSLTVYYKLQGEQPCKSFSIYWLNQLMRILNRQTFNPILVYKLLEKLYITPYNPSNQCFNSPTSQILYNKTKILNSEIPTIFQKIISNLNQLAVWQDIQKILQFKAINNSGKLDLINTLLDTNKQEVNSQVLFYTLKLVKLIFSINNLLVKYQLTCPNHFIVRTLSAMNFLKDTKINSLFTSNLSKNNIIMSVIATFQYQRQYKKESFNEIIWQTERKDEQQPEYQQLLKYVAKNKKLIDCQQASNLLKRPNNESYQYQNIISVSLDIIIEVLRFSPQSSIENSITMIMSLTENDKYIMRNQIYNKFVQIINKFIDTPNVSCKIIEFIYNLKYNCGVNKLHERFSTKLFDQFIRINKNTEKTPKFNSIICKYLLRQLQRQNKKYQGFTQQFIQGIITNFQFKDSFLNKYYQFKDTREIGRMIQRYYLKNYGMLNLNQLERMIQQRAIVDIAYQLEYINTVADIIITQIIRRKHSQSIINCIQMFNALLVVNNMLLFQKDFPSQFRVNKNINNFDFNHTEPRLYIRDPLQLYITSTKDSKKKNQVQMHQKNNIIEWFIGKSLLVSERLTRYTKFILTINKYPYSNNPISFTIQKNDPANLQLFTHISLGKMNYTASELFGKSTSESIDAVQGIACNLINRLTESRKLNEGCGFDEAYKEGLRMLGYCLEWLRGKDRYGQNSSHSLIKRLHKNYFFLLPEGNQILTSQSIKIFLSVLSMGQKYFTVQAKGHIHTAVYNLIFKYWMTIQKGFILEEVRSLGELVQQAISILILIPPQKNETQIFELLINIWVKQKNYQFFFNQSRLILELATLYPQEIVRLQPFTRCQIVSNLSNFYCRYEDKQRRFDSIAWTWIVKIASQLVNNSQSVLVISQVSSFLKHYKDRFICLFDVHDQINRSYAEDLQAALELLVCLFSHDLWVNFNRQLAEQFTYLLSHNLIKVFIAYVQGRLSFSVSSSNDKSLLQIKCSTVAEQEFNQNIDHLTQDNTFITYMRIKLNHCIRNYCILMKKAFKSSHFVEVYFENIIFDNNKYFSSFWDIFNKNIITLFIYASKQFKIWNSVKKLNDALNTLQECCNAPNTFVENGYLSTIIELPRNEYELFSDLYLLNYLIAELAVVHYLKQKLYVSKYNNLLASHIDSFSRRIKEHIDTVKIQTKKISGQFNQYVSEKDFVNISEVIEINKARKIL